MFFWFFFYHSLTEAMLGNVRRLSVSSTHKSPGQETAREQYARDSACKARGRLARQAAVWGSRPTLDVTS